MTDRRITNMKKYIEPVMDIRNFREENIVVTNSVVIPGGGENYTEGTDNTENHMQDTRYVIRWTL